MTSRDFCYWLQGYFEIVGAAPDDVVGNLCEKRVQTIKNHLAMVFKHEIDPSHGDAQHQKSLSAAHKGVSDSDFLKSIQECAKESTSMINC